jgi:hypothetical protein
MATAPENYVNTAKERPLYVAFPLKHRSKEPAVRFKSKDKFNTEGIPNVGRRLDGLIVLDVDAGRLPVGVTVEGAINTLKAMGVPVEQCPRVRTGSGGEHIYLRCPDATAKFKAKLVPWVDIKAGDAAYVVAPGSVHPNGSKYEELNAIPLEQAPIAPPQLMRVIERPSHQTSEAQAPGALETHQLAVVLQALAVEEFREHDRWLELMMACRHACPEGEHEFVEWSIGDPIHAQDAHKTANRWHTVDPFAEGGVTIATLYQRLIEAKQERPDDLAPRRALAVLDFAETVHDEPGVTPLEQVGASPNPVEFFTAAGLLHLPATEWLVESAVPCGSLVVLYGPPKSAKTFMALDVALSIATGRGEVHGLKCRSGRALYVLGEGGCQR